MSIGRNPVTSGLFKSFRFESFGVNVVVESDSAELLSMARGTVKDAFADSAVIFDSDGQDPTHVFGVTKLGDKFVLYRNGSERESGRSERNFFNYLNSSLRLEVAEHAVDKVFVHSGVIEHNGKALLLPGTSGSGKSTLTAELVRSGAVYYSDEYAVLNAEGKVEPFARKLSLDSDGSNGPRNVTAEELGGVAGVGPKPVGMILFTHYDEAGEWGPEYLSIGTSIMELIPNTLTMRKNPGFALNVLDLAAQRAIILKSPRGDAKTFAQILLDFFDKNTKLAKMT